MAALTSLPFVFLFTCSWSFVLCQGTQQVNVTAGVDATLQCQGPGGAAIALIKWSRTDLKSDDGYVLYLRDGRSFENYQHESFRGRVELRDPEMKDGDASVILKNVTFNDTGTYECRVREKKDTGKVELISIVNMTVTEPGHTAARKEGGDEEGGGKEGGQKEGNVGLKVGLPVFVNLLLCVGGFVIFKKCRKPTEKEQPPANEAEKQNLHRTKQRQYLRPTCC